MDILCDSKIGGNVMEETNKKIKVIGSRVINVGYRLHILEEAERRKIARLDMKNVKDTEKKKEMVEILLGRVFCLKQVNLGRNSRKTGSFRDPVVKICY